VIAGEMTNRRRNVRVCFSDMPRHPASGARRKSSIMRRCQPAVDSVAKRVKIDGLVAAVGATCQCFARVRVDIGRDHYTGTYGGLLSPLQSQGRSCRM